MNMAEVRTRAVGRLVISFCSGAAMITELQLRGKRPVSTAVEVSCFHVRSCFAHTCESKVHGT